MGAGLPCAALPSTELLRPSLAAERPRAASPSTELLRPSLTAELRGARAELSCSSLRGTELPHSSWPTARLRIDAPVTKRSLAELLNAASVGSDVPCSDPVMGAALSNPGWSRA